MLRKLSTAMMPILAAACGVGSATAQTAHIVSTYSSTAPKDCRTLRGGGENDGGVRACKGPFGLAVVVSEGDLKETVSAGRSVRVAEGEPAAKTWFGPFNSTTHTIEWRSVGKTKPFAMIQRWHLADIEDEGKDHRPNTKPMLVVTRMPPGKVCHVAYVDLQANADANDLARKAADDIARDFKCGTDKVQIIGNRGRGVELAAPD